MGFPAAGLANRTPAEVLEQGVYKCMLDIAYLIHGVCRECAGPISSAVSVCDDHLNGAGPACEDCGSPYEVWVNQQCERCGLAKRLPVEMLTMGLAPVISFFYEHGVDVFQPSYEELDVLIDKLYSTSVENDPLRIHVTIETETAELTVTLDDTMTVLDVTSQRSDVTSDGQDNNPSGRSIRSRSGL